ncbi:hypothetical protein Clacol_010405 [Clathrus columnatus]|uniref:Ribosomal RNA-processing protein 41 n=1 Tax=Clathrus columnatus TaxID=1419009 RepID=A0AAV5ANR6_9AGAM|nr:hypothetical protein Clacol_010405 [Clathrus columnatus]
MGSRVEILNHGGYRSDGRRQYELRNFDIDFSGSNSTADGYCTVTHGLTTVIAFVFGPREASQRNLTMHDRAIINVEVNVAPFSSNDRRRRGRGDRRLLELAASIKSTFEPVVQIHLYPRSEIDIFIQVMEQDGGFLQAAINATTLALINAGIPMIDYVAAVTCGVSSTKPLLDLTTLEENDVPHVTVAVMPKTGKVTLVTMETRLHVDRFDEILNLAISASKTLHLHMRAAVRGYTTDLVRAMGSTGSTGKEAAMEDENMDVAI